MGCVKNNQDELTKLQPKTVKNKKLINFNNFIHSALDIKYTKYLRGKIYNKLKVGLKSSIVYYKFFYTINLQQECLILKGFTFWISRRLNLAFV